MPFRSLCARSVGSAARHTSLLRSTGAAASAGKNTERHCVSLGLTLTSAAKNCVTSFATTMCALFGANAAAPRRRMSLTSASATAVPGHPSASASASAAPPVTSTSETFGAFSSRASNPGPGFSSSTLISAASSVHVSRDIPGAPLSSDPSEPSPEKLSVVASSAAGPCKSARSPSALAATQRTEGASAANAARSTRTHSFDGAPSFAHRIPSSPSARTASFRTLADALARPGRTRFAIVASTVSSSSDRAGADSSRSDARNRLCARHDASSSCSRRRCSAAPSTARAASAGESLTSLAALTNARSHSPEPPSAYELCAPATSRWTSSAEEGFARSCWSTSVAAPLRAVASARSTRARRARSCLATKRAPASACALTRSRRSTAEAGSAASSASSNSPAAAEFTTWFCPTAVAAVSCEVCASRCRLSHTTRQYTAASGFMSASGSATPAETSRRSPPPGGFPFAVDAEISFGFILPHAMSSRTTISPTASFVSTSNAARRARTSPSNASCQRLSISTAAARTEGARSFSPRRAAVARRAMEMASTGTLLASARNATRRTSSDASRVRSTTCGMVKSEMASDPRMAFRTSLFFSAPRSFTNECVMASSAKLPSWPPSWRRDNARAAWARTPDTLSRRRSSITASMRSYRSSEISASAPSELSTPATI